MKQMLVLFCLFWLAFPGEALAQKTRFNAEEKKYPYRNSVYIELGGNTMVGSFNYERLIIASNARFNVACRLGGIYIPVIGILGGPTTHELFIPAEINFLGGKRALKAEFGAGLTYNWSSGEHVIFQDRHETSSASLVYTVLRAGIRWQKEQNPYFIRAGFTPLFFGSKATNSDLPFMPYYGVSFGKSY